MEEGPGRADADPALAPALLLRPLVVGVGVEVDSRELLACSSSRSPSWLLSVSMRTGTGQET